MNSIYDRRRFLSHSLKAGLGMATLGSGVLSLAANAAERNLRGANDYRALVFIQLDGGNDAYNTVIPRTPSVYNTYAAARLNLAIPSNQVLAINPLTNTGVNWGFHPACTQMRDLFESQRLAIIANTGSLIVPTSRSDFINQSVPLPPRLFSHNDQRDQWATSRPDISSRTGWGGRLADRIRSMNVNQQISMNISLSGSNLFQVGDDVSLFTLAPTGPEVLQLFGTGLGGTGNAYMALQNLDHRHLMARQFSTVQLRGLSVNQNLIDAMNQVPAPTTVFPGGSLGAQLRMVARMLSIRQNINVQRQIFYVSVGGWDFHDDLLDNQMDLLANLSANLQAFYDATVELGVASSVTTLVASEFGRSLTVNGDGSDHGWGGHAFVMGDAVNGRDIYGQMPNLLPGGPDDTQSGRFIPTTSVDQVGATLSRWLGASGGDISDIFPNLANFSSNDLGFMQA